MPFKCKVLKLVICLVAPLAHSKAGSRALLPAAQAQKHPPTLQQEERATLLFITGDDYVEPEPLNDFPFPTVCHHQAHWSEVSNWFISFTFFERESFAHGHSTVWPWRHFIKNNEMKLTEMLHSIIIIWFVSILGCSALKFACERLDPCFCSSTLLSPEAQFIQG